MTSADALSRAKSGPSQSPRRSAAPPTSATATSPTTTTMTFNASTARRRIRSHCAFPLSALNAGNSVATTLAGRITSRFTASYGAA